MKTPEDAIAGSVDPVVRPLSRLEIETAVAAIARDCPFTMPFFLAGLLVEELRRQKLNTVTYTGTDFTVAVRIKKAKRSNDQAQRRRE